MKARNECILDYDQLVLMLFKPSLTLVPRHRHHSLHRLRSLAELGLEQYHLLVLL